VSSQNVTKSKNISKKESLLHRGRYRLLSTVSVKLAAILAILFDFYTFFFVLPYRLPTEPDKTQIAC